MYCKKCGTELRENDTFCYYCGNRIGWMQRMLSSKAFIGSVIAVFVVIIAAVLTYLIWTGKITMPSFDKGQTTERIFPCHGLFTDRNTRVLPKDRRYGAPICRARGGDQL